MSDLKIIKCQHLIKLADQPAEEIERGKDGWSTIQFADGTQTEIKSELWDNKDLFIGYDEFLNRPDKVPPNARDQIREWTDKEKLSGKYCAGGNCNE